jgi:hypothetical protein
MFDLLDPGHDVRFDGVGKRNIVTSQDELHISGATNHFRGFGGFLRFFCRADDGGFYQ